MKRGAGSDGGGGRGGTEKVRIAQGGVRVAVAAAVEESGKLAIVMSVSVSQDLKWTFNGLLCELQLGHLACNAVNLLIYTVYVLVRRIEVSFGVNQLIYCALMGI